MECTNSRVQLLVSVKIILGKKKMKLLQERCGNLITEVNHKGDNRWELFALKKNAKKFVKAVLSFFEEEGISHFTRDKKNSRFIFPFVKGLLPSSMARRLGLSYVKSAGYVFSETTEAVKESLKPPVNEEEKAFEKFDKEADEIMAKFIESRQLTAKKWLELTVHVARNSEV